MKAEAPRLGLLLRFGLADADGGLPTLPRLPGRRADGLPGELPVLPRLGLLGSAARAGNGCPAGLGATRTIYAALVRLANGADRDSNRRDDLLVEEDVLQAAMLLTRFRAIRKTL